MNIDWVGIHKAAPMAHWVTVDRYGSIMAHSSAPNYTDISGTWNSTLFPSPVKLGMSAVGSDFQASSALYVEEGFEAKPVVIRTPKPVDDADEFLRAQNLMAGRYGDAAKNDRLTNIAAAISTAANAKPAVEPTMKFSVDPNKSPQAQFAAAVVQFCDLVSQAGSFGAKQVEVQQQLTQMKAVLSKL